MKFIRNILLLALLAPLGCLGDEDVNEEACTMHLYEFSVNGMKCEGCDKFITQSYGKEVTLFNPFGMTVLKIHMVPTRVEGVDHIDLTVAKIEGDNPEEEMSSDLIKKLIEDGIESELGKASVAIEEETSVLLAFDEFSFRVHCPRPRFLKPLEVPTVKDEDGNVLTGSIYVGTDVDENGAIKKSFTLGDADKRLKQAAMQVLEDAGFHPPILDGEPVEMRYAYRVVFEK